MSKKTKPVAKAPAKAKDSKAPLTQAAKKPIVPQAKAKADDQKMKTNEVRFETARPGQSVGKHVETMFIAGPEFGFAL